MNSGTIIQHEKNVPLRRIEPVCRVSMTGENSDETGSKRRPTPINFPTGWFRAYFGTDEELCVTFKQSDLEYPEHFRVQIAGQLQGISNGSVDNRRLLIEATTGKVFSDAEWDAIDRETNKPFNNEALEALALDDETWEVLCLSDDDVAKELEALEHAKQEDRPLSPLTPEQSDLYQDWLLRDANGPMPAWVKASTAPEWLESICLEQEKAAKAAIAEVTTSTRDAWLSFDRKQRVAADLYATAIEAHFPPVNHCFRPEPLYESSNKKAVVQSIANYLRKGCDFARGADQELYSYQDGVYVKGGEATVQREVKAWCEETKMPWVSNELADRVVDYLLIDAPKLWESPPLNTVNVLNGLVHVPTRTLWPHTPKFLSPVQLPVTFDHTAKCPAIRAFCKDVLKDDSQDILGHITAWLMLPDTNIQKAVLLLGAGANGKTAFLNIVQDFIGTHNISTATLHSLESNRFAMCSLVGKLANICPDLPTKALSDTSVFKRITGGDSLDGEEKYGKRFSFRPYSRLLFSANTAPRSDDATSGFYRRWLVVPFGKRTFSEQEAIPSSILRACLGSPSELSGLLNWSLDSIPQIQEGFIPEPESMRTAWSEFRAATDPLSQWIEENLEVTALDLFLTKKEVLAGYSSDRRDIGKPGTDRGNLTQALAQFNVKPGQRKVGDVERVWCYLNVKWRPKDKEGKRDKQKSF